MEGLSQEELPCISTFSLTYETELSLKPLVNKDMSGPPDKQWPTR